MGALMNADSNSPYTLRESEFNDIRELVHASTGIALSTSKMELVKRRFSPRLKALGLETFGAYVNYLRSNFSSEEVHFCNAITTNLTSFFRENHHFELLVNSMLPELLSDKRPDRRIRIWSAGCSTGQEAYCLALLLHKNIPDLARRDVRILATDLDENCLSRARQGSYPVTEFEQVPDVLISTYFKHEVQMHGRQEREVYTAKDNIKSLITFNKLNLMHGWPMKGPFDIIFCRNVFIYFDKPTQLKVLEEFSSMQDDRGFLCLGHSEIISNPAELGYSLIGKTAYRKISGRRY
jgi:chemotaxis protein methyltransferase CheR